MYHELFAEDKSIFEDIKMASEDLITYFFFQIAIEVKFHLIESYFHYLHIRIYKTKIEQSIIKF